MAGTVPQRPMGSSSGAVAGPVSASAANSFRVLAVAERLAMQVRTGQRTDPKEFVNLCLSLARGIDYAVANNEVPAKAHDLPSLLKQVYQGKNEFIFQAAVMVLMISVKNACKNRWFPVKDTEDLLTLAKEIGSSFCSTEDLNTEPSYAHPTVSKVMSRELQLNRFYPQMKMGIILASLEVKPGYGVFVTDFHIPRNTMAAAQEKIRLFVAQADNMETSSCIISPPQVNFLLNGKGVERRTSVSMDNGPQFPTNVTAMLKYGTNLLQAVGQFNGHYIIVIAFMSVLSSSDTPVLQDYVQPVVAALDSDSDLIEGPSRISLNCPISLRRIKTPVKGNLCKHRQVLREVGDDVVDVIISADGSWKAVLESDDHTDQLHDRTVSCQQDGSEQCEAKRFSNTPSNLVDLTVGGDENDIMRTSDTEDRKPFQDNFQGYAVAGNLTVPPEVNNTYEAVQNTVSEIEDDFWSGILLSIPSDSYGSAAPSTRSDAHMVGGISEFPTVNFMSSPVLTDAVSPALNQGSVDVHAATQLTTSLPQTHFFSPSSMQLQQSQFGISIVGNEQGRLASIPRHVTRTPIAVQALPALSQVPSSQRSRTSLNSLIPNGAFHTASQTSPSMSPISDGFNATGSDMERQQRFTRSRPLMNPPTVPDMAASSMQHHAMTQNRDHQDYIPSQSTQQFTGLPATSQVPGAYRGSSGLISEHQNAHYQQPPSLARPSYYPPPQVQQGRALGGISRSAVCVANEHARLKAAAQRASQMSRQPPAVPVQLQAPRGGSSFPMTANGQIASLEEQRVNMRAMVQPASGADSLMELPLEQNWRPTGRMRGSLTGRAYSDALSQFITQPIHPPQAARPPSNLTSPLASPPQLHPFIANNFNLPGPPTQTYSKT
ncbi:hypothetical protein HHK36_029042 [Tetracentron sinense]|uniref:Uncharacterized protein n=1 Tax=Tetracentron sinense TaxID=13715 RepID=A0A835D375_TETSI|nr:hypothetical protein HHK36_029042 [Tetracentron sinense]